MICLYARYFLYKPLFPASQPSKTFKNRVRDIKIYLGNHLQLIPTRKTTENDQNRPTTRPKSTYVDLCFLYEPILGPLQARFDQLDR